MEVMSSCASKCSLPRLENIEENSPALLDAVSCAAIAAAASAAAPETPTESMEFLARSWSVSAMELSKALSNSHVASHSHATLVKPSALSSEASRVHRHDHDTQNSATLKESVVEQIPSESSPPISPRGSDEMKELFLLHQALNPDFLSNQQQLLKNGVYKSIVRKRTMGRWVRDQKERKKHEMRTHNAQLHAAVSVAGVAAAVAALAASAAVPEAPVARRGAKAAAAAPKTSAAMASAAGLVASHCIEIAEEMGADHDNILGVVNSAVNARTNGDIMTLTAAAATALRGAAILRTRMQKGYGSSGTTAFALPQDKSQLNDSNILTALNFVSTGGELLKRTRKGALHWKRVSFSINSNWQVVAKMKSKYMAGTFTKKRKCVVSGVCCDVMAWPGRDKESGGESRTYFGIKTVDRVIEFECRSKEEKLMWTEGIQHMLNCHTNVSMF